MTKKCIFALRDQLCEIIDFNTTSNDFEIEQKVKRFFSENSLQQDTRYLNYFRNTHETVLMYACRNNKANIVKLLIEAGADLNVQDHCKRTALFYAISSGSSELSRAEVENNREIISTIVDAIGRDKWDSRNGTGYDALLWAIKIGYLPTVKLLIEKGFEINSTKKKRTHALSQAVSEKTPNVEVVNYLIRIGANVNECDEYGTTPLMCVFKPEVARILIENGADLNFKDIHGKTALMVNTYNQVEGKRN
jgi:ankyrin repeat protein